MYKKKLKDYLNGDAFNCYLRSKVGQSWDKVYSEICSMADPRTSEGSLVRRDLKWHVNLSGVLMINGVPYTTRWGSHTTTGYYPIYGLYVHPETGILCEAPKPDYVSWRQPHVDETDIDYIRLEDETEYKKIKGAWFHVWVDKRLRELYQYYPLDMKYIQIENKQQLSKKEIRDIIKPNLLKGTNQKFYDRVKEYIPASKWNLNG